MLYNATFFLLLLLFSQPVISQDNTFTYVGKFETQEALNSYLQKSALPCLVVDEDIYVIGSDCISRALDGDMSDRDSDNNSNDRDSDGENNNRSKFGTNNERNKAGGIAERKTKGSKRNRDNDGDNNNRDSDNDVNDRDKDGASGNRNKAGAISEGVRCAIDRKGKVLLYSRKKIDVKRAKIYYQNKYFNKKYFKIIQL